MYNFKCLSTRFGVLLLTTMTLWNIHRPFIPPTEASFVKDFYAMLFDEDADDAAVDSDQNFPTVQRGDIFVAGRIRIKAEELGPPLTGMDLAYYAAKGLKNDGTNCHSPDSPKLPIRKPEHIKKDVYQGDILTNPEHVKALKEEVGGGGGDYKTMPGYAEDTRDDRAVLSKALETFHSETCLQFVPRTDEADFIHITPVNSPNQDFCASVVGKQNGGQLVCLDKGCLSCLGHPVHELMHAAGFWHEQSRPDRNQHIKIMWDNIRPGEEHNFKMHDPKEINLLNSEYDIGSVMHYGPYFFARDPSKKTIVNKYPIPVGVHMGQRVGPSALDVQKMNRLYKCSIPCDNDYYKGTTECLIQKLNGSCFEPQMQQHCKRACGFCW
ncbi:unnamed protein product [Notodromas monacha]|uniref:Metalloendopeptidase n=1 Tax=Notodromas monacha TaxID=399045 RepID=A0A7R9BU95_9CRUS|nr:unnamed protein product [Notodromas monacha]CAG0920796.1 unnamed protein product [Notodromas monacha]